MLKREERKEREHDSRKIVKINERGKNVGKRGEEEALKTIQVTVRRYNRQQGSYTQQYAVPVEEKEIQSVMNLLEYIYENLDSTLAFFYHAACRQAACGKCLVKINGKVALACKERADGQPLLLAPYHNNVVKDLICR